MNIDTQTDLAFPDRAVPFFSLFGMHGPFGTQTLHHVELRDVGDFVQYFIVEAGS